MVVPTFSPSSLEQSYVNLCEFHGQLGLCGKFQVSQDFIVRFCLKNTLWMMFWRHHVNRWRSKQSSKCFQSKCRNYVSVECSTLSGTFVGHLSIKEEGGADCKTQLSRTKVKQCLLDMTESLYTHEVTTVLAAGIRSAQGQANQHPSREESRCLSPYR